MAITINNELGTAIINAILSRVPSLAYDYDRTQAAPLATPPATCHRKMCSIERAILARDLAATVAAMS